MKGRRIQPPCHKQNIVLAASTQVAARYAKFFCQTRLALPPTSLSMYFTHLADKRAPWFVLFLQDP